MIACGDYDLVLGSRILGNGALRGGMPLWQVRRQPDPHAGRELAPRPEALRVPHRASRLPARGARERCRSSAIPTTSCSTTRSSCRRSPPASASASSPARRSIFPKRRRSTSRARCATASESSRAGFAGFLARHRGLSRPRSCASTAATTSRRIARMTAADLVVVGGGPAGLATAIAARRHGLTVTVLERRRPPLDKACGEGLLPAGRLGARAARRRAAGAALSVSRHPLPLRRRASPRPTFRTARAVSAFAAPSSRRRCSSRRKRSASTSASAFAPRRSTGERVSSSAGEFAGRFVVGADGLHSALRRDAGLERPTSARPRFGVTRHFRGAPWSDHVEVLFGDRAEAYVTPLADDEIGVAILWSGGKGGFDELLATRFPPALDLAARLARLTPLGRDLGAGPFRQRVRPADEVGARSRRRRRRLRRRPDRRGDVARLRAGRGARRRARRAWFRDRRARSAARRGVRWTATSAMRGGSRRSRTGSPASRSSPRCAPRSVGATSRRWRAIPRSSRCFSARSGSRRPLGAGAVLRLASRLVVPGTAPTAAATSA